MISARIISWRLKLPSPSKRKSTLSWHLSELAALVLVWANLVTSTYWTAALTQGHSHGTVITAHNFREKPRVIFELVLQITANIHMLVFLLLFEQTRQKLCSDRFIINSPIKMHWHELHDVPVISEISSLVRQWSAWTAWRTSATFSSVLLMEGWPQCSWSSTDISPILKWLTHFYICVLPTALSLEASLNIVTVSSAVFPKTKQNFTHTL